MVERGIVIRNDENGIDVQMHSGQSCEGCNACLMDKNKIQVLHINQDLVVKPGDVVEVEIPPAFAIQSAFLLFFLPLVMLIAGYFFFTAVVKIPGWQPLYRGILGGIGSFILTYFGVFYYDKHLRTSEVQYTVRISRITGHSLSG
jgi:positive regulator of sigma E activity